MKRKFVTPNMEIKMFESENIVTLSGGYAEIVENELGISGDNLTQKKFSEVFVTF